MELLKPFEVQMLCMVLQFGVNPVGVCWLGLIFIWHIPILLLQNSNVYSIPSGIGLQAYNLFLMLHVFNGKRFPSIPWEILDVGYLNGVKTRTLKLNWIKFAL